MRTVRELRGDFRNAATMPLALGLIAALVVALLLVRAGTNIAPSRSASRTAPAEPALTPEQRTALKQFNSMPRAAIPVDREGATVAIVEFNDLQCPACAVADSLYRPLLDKWERDAPGRVKLFVKDFPLERECNPNVGRDLHPAACEAAVAVRLARRRQRDVALAQWFYRNQASMAPNSVRSAARSIGAVEDLDARYADTLEEVKKDVALGTALNVRSTPTFFVNGVRLDRFPPPDVLDVMIAQELRRHAESRR